MPEVKTVWVALNVALGIACGVSLAKQQREHRLGTPATKPGLGKAE